MAWIFSPNIMRIQISKRPLSLVFFLIAGITGFASDKMDLSRTLPVTPSDPIPTVDFIRQDTLSEPAINRTGTSIAALIPDETGYSSLLFYDVETHKADGIVYANANSFNWLDERRVLFFSGADAYAVDFDHNGERKISTKIVQRSGWPLIVGIPKNNPLHPLVWLRSDNDNHDMSGGVVALNIDPGSLVGPNAQATSEFNQRHKLVTYPVPPGGLDYGYIADKDGALAFGFTSQNGVLAMFQILNRRWDKCPVYLESTDIVSCGNKAGEVLVLAPNREGKPRTLQFMDAATGRLGEVLLRDEAYDFNGSIYRDPVSHDVTGAVFQRIGPKVVWFNEGYRTVQKILDGFFPGLVAQLIGSDETGRRYLVSTYSDRQPATYYVVDLEKRTAGLFKNSRPWIDSKRMQPMNMMRYKTRDGHELDAYVTLPAVASSKNPPPLVVFPHDGPWERNVWGFDGIVQFLTSHGYAVLQPNYRGSPGYNWMFPEEDQWAFRKMGDDVTDATKTLTKAGLVDGNRVAILGWGFGAYLAIAGVTNEPTLYRCAVANQGMFDWAQFIKDEKYYQYDSPAYGRFVRKLGDPKKEKDRFDEISPIHHVDQIRVPILVTQSKSASGEAMAQSRKLDKELGANHLPHELVIFDFSVNFLEQQTDRDLRVLKKKVEFYDRIVSFLDKNLKPIRMPMPDPSSGPQNH